MSFVLLAGACTLAPAAPAAVPTMEAAVAEVARDTLRAQAERDGLLAAEVDVVVTLLGAKEAPRCTQPPLVDAIETRFAARMRFAARCPGTDGTRTQFTVRGSLSAEVVVAAANVPAGRPLAAAELTVDRRELGSIADPLGAIDDAVGQASLRPLRPGQVLQKRLLAAPVLVKRGDAVQIEARSGPVQVSASGEALEPGRQGDVVRVRNVNTGKVIRARVVEAGTVAPVEMN